MNDFAAIVWISWITLFAIFEGAALYNKKKGDTLSEKTRLWFRIYTVPGRIAFALVWFWFSVWFFIHILWG